MILWRISNYADLSGTGGLLYPGRWHNRGRPVVYLAASAAGALLEVLVHVEAAHPSELPKDYQLLEVEVPDGRVCDLHDVVDGATDVPSRESSLAPLDPAFPASPTTLTRRLGDQWLAGGASLLLRVPSAVVARTFNYLLNPQHPDAGACVIRSVARYPFDVRLLETGGPRGQ